MPFVVLFANSNHNLVIFMADVRGVLDDLNLDCEKLQKGILYP